MFSLFLCLLQLGKRLSTMEARFESAIPTDPTLSHIHTQLQQQAQEKRAREQAIAEARAKAKNEAKLKARAKQAVVVVSRASCDRMRVALYGVTM